MIKQCLVRQQSDQMTCVCGNTWDVNDPDPPVCPKANQKPWPIFDSPRIGRSFVRLMETPHAICYGPYDEIERVVELGYN